MSAYIYVYIHVCDYGDCACIGGDQMTVARTRGCKRIRSNAERGKERLEGFTALVEDWHAKVAFLGVSMYMYIDTANNVCE